MLNGADDHPYAATAHELVAAIPGARRVEIPGADHLGPVTDPRFLEEALAFLGRR